MVILEKRKKGNSKMATNLNSGFTNNINVIQIRTNGAHGIRVTDRAIDFNGDGEVEKVTITHTSGHAAGTPSAPGGKIKNTINKPVGIARSIISEVTETDGGVNLDTNVSEFSEGVS
jgi:hypothetical protein